MLAFLAERSAYVLRSIKRQAIGRPSPRTKLISAGTVLCEGGRLSVTLTLVRGRTAQFLSSNLGSLTQIQLCCGAIGGFDENSQGDGLLRWVSLL